MTSEDFTNLTNMDGLYGSNEERASNDPVAPPLVDFGSGSGYEHNDDPGISLLQYPTSSSTNQPTFRSNNGPQYYDQTQSFGTLQTNISQQSTAAYGLTNFSFLDTRPTRESNVQNVQNSGERSLRPLLPKQGGSNSYSHSLRTTPETTTTTSSSINAYFNTALPDISPKTQTQTLLPHSSTQYAKTSYLQRPTQNPCSSSSSSFSTTTSQNRWHLCTLYRTQIHQPPYLPPSQDPTIQTVHLNAENWVSHLTTALLNTSSVKDRPTSHALKLFSPPSPPAPLLLESTSRSILTHLLSRCIHGFRGPPHFNKALKPARDMEADKTATCEERLRNVVEALMWNKRVCKDVLYEDWKIRLLVNAPLAYDREKDAQMGSNEQRKRRLVGERERLRVVEGELRAVRGSEGVDGNEERDGRDEKRARIGEN